MIVLESNQNHATIKDTEVCPTLPSSMGMGGGYVPMIIQKTIEHNSRNIKPNAGGGAQCVVIRREDGSDIHLPRGGEHLGSQRFQTTTGGNLCKE